MNGQLNGNAGGSTSSQAAPPDPSSGNWLNPAPSLGEHTIDTVAGRILCIADIRGKVSKLNDLADRHNAKAIIHTGDFGFYDKDSIERMTVRTLRHVVQYSSLIDAATKEKYFPTQENPKDTTKVPASLGQLREALLNPSPEQLQDQNGQDFILSEFPKLLSGEITLKVPVYTIWGACEDVHIIEKLRLAAEPNSTSPLNKNSKNEYAIPNLTVLSESVTRLLNIGGVKLRLFGLGGSLVYHKLFDNGEGNATIAGGSGTMWTTALQIGELVDTAQRVYDATETRVLVTHASPGREGLLAQLAIAIKADFTISGSLHFRFGTSYNDFSVQSEPSVFRNKLLLSSKRFREVYDIVKTQVDNAIDNQQKKLLKLAVGVADRIPNENAEESAWKNSWHWNLPDAMFGSLVLDIRDGRIGTEQKSTGFNFAYRLTLNNKSGSKEGQAPAQTQTQPPTSSSAQTSNQASNQAHAGPSKRPLQVPFAQQRVFSNHHNNAQRHQEPPKQGYIGGARSEQAQQQQQQQQRQQQQQQPQQPQQQSATSSPAPPATNETSTTTPSVNPPPAGPSLGPRGPPPTPRDFENLASMAFKKSVDTQAAPGAGRGRGSTRGQGHQKGTSSGTGRSSPAEPIGSGRKEAHSKQNSSMSNDASAEDAPTGSNALAENSNTGTNGSAGEKPADATQATGPQRRTSGFNQGRGQSNSSDWRVPRSEQTKESQPEEKESGNESPSGTGSTFRGRGRGRGNFDSGRGRGGEFRGRGGPRPDGPHRGRGSYDGARGSFRGGRGGAGSRNASEGEATAKPDNTASDKPKPAAPAGATEGASSA